MVDSVLILCVIIVLFDLIILTLYLKMPRCSHQWRHIETIRITDDGYMVGQKYVMCCEKCGWKKVVKV